MRSMTAVFAGFLCMSVLVMAATALAAALLLEGAAPTRSYVVVNLAYSTAFAAVGGYVTARLAPRRSFGHVIALAAVIGLLSAASALATSAQGGQPTWYGGTIGGLGVAGILVGGAVRSRTA